MAAFDLAVVGAGILGLAHALAAVRRGKSCIVIDRDAQANGASIRNFGFITVTGQKAGPTFRRAMRSRDVWDEVAAPAGIPILQSGLLLVARRPEARTVLEAFARTQMGEGLSLLEPAEARRRYPMLRPNALAGALYSPHERRVESREAIPRLAAWLAEQHGVTFRRLESVVAVEPGRVVTSRGTVDAAAIVVCPGDDLATLFPDRIAAHGITRCRLQMLRVAPPSPEWRIPCPLMSDLSFVRYHGYADLPEAADLRRRLDAEQPRHLANGIHLIAVQSGDGSLVVGDSHHYADTPEPFADERVDDLILDEFAEATGHRAGPVLERWTGTYASGPEPMMMDRPDERIRLVLITSGTGASTSFAIAEETLADLYD